MHGYNIDTEKRKTCPISFKHALTVFSKHCNPTGNLEQLWNTNCYWAKEPVCNWHWAKSKTPVCRPHCSSANRLGSPHPPLWENLVQFKQSRTNRSQLNTINTFRNWAIPPVLLLSLLQKTHQCRVLLFIVHGIHRAPKGHHPRVILQRHHAALATTLRPQMNWK